MHETACKARPHTQSLWAIGRRCGWAGSLARAPGGGIIQRLVLVLPKNLGEEGRQDAAQQQVGVGDGQVAALTVAHRPWVRPR